MVFFLTSLGLVFAAELGDKTQLVAMAFAARYAAWKVLAGVLAATALLNVIAVILGAFITTVIPLNTIRIAAAVVFILFGILNLKEDKDEGQERRVKLGPILTVALTFFIGEFGDKTQLMTVTLSAQYRAPYAIFLGSTVGMLIADSLGIIIGSTIFKRITQGIVKAFASSIFIFFGTIGLYSTLPDRFVTTAYIVLYALIIIIMVTVVYKSNNRENKRFRPD